MFFRVFCCLVLLAITAAAQRPGITPQSSKRVAIAVSRDGNMLAVARGNDGLNRRYGRVELWSTRTGELQHIITGFDGPVWSLAFSRDGKFVITASTEYRDSKIQSSVKNRDLKVVGELKWWDTQTGEFIKKLSVGGDGMHSLETSVSPAGDVAALIERSSDLRVEPVELSGSGLGPIFTTAISSVKTELKLIDPQTGERKIKLDDAGTSHKGYMAWLFTRLERPVFSYDGSKVAALAGEDVKIWDVRTGDKIRTIKNLDGWPTALAFSEDGKTLAVAIQKGEMPAGDSEIIIWDISTGKSINKLKGHHDSIASLQFATQGRALLIGSLQYQSDGAVGTVKMWDLRENRLGRLNVHADAAVLSLTLIPDQGAVVLQSGPDVELRDAKTWEVRQEFEATRVDENESMRRRGFLLTAKRASSVAFSADGLTVSATIEGEGTRVWDVRTGELKTQTPADSATDARFLPETNAQDQITIRDTKSKAVVKTLDAGQKITAVTIDPNGQLVAAALADYSIRLWNLTTGALAGELRKHQNIINALAFSPDGHTLASGGDDGTAILWDIPSGKARRTLKGHEVTITSFAFSPDGSTLATGSGNAAVVLWNVATGKLDRILR